jgi:small-conductance mechanosensitive channel
MRLQRPGSPRLNSGSTVAMMVSPESRARMNTPFSFWDPRRFFAEMPHKLMVQVQSPEFLIQCAIIVLSGFLAYWLGILARPALTRVALRHVPRNWGPGFIRSAEYIAAPLFWLLALWAAELIGAMLGLAMPVVGAGIDLVLAWIAIRLLSFTVRSHTISAVISVAAWSIAALNILNLYGPLVDYLRSLHVYDRDKTHFITALDTMHAVIVLIVLLWLTRLVYRALHRLINQATSLTPSLQVLFIQLLQIFLPAIAVIIALQSIGLDLTTLTVAFGAIGLGVGLGLQRVVANLVAGLTLLIGKTIKPGDIIEYKNSYGWVTGMGARYVTLRTRDGVEHLVPNDYFLTNGVENWSYSDVRLRLRIPVTISYDSDLRKAIALGIEAAKSVKRVIERPEPLCLVKAFGDSGIDLEVRAWIEDPRNGTQNVKSEVMLALWDRYNEAGISFPVPQRDVRIVSAPEGGEMRE